MDECEHEVPFLNLYTFINFINIIFRFFKHVLVDIYSQLNKNENAAIFCTELNDSLK